jgi:hypothetical protein
MDFAKITYGGIDVYKVKLDGIDKEDLLKEIYVNKRFLFDDMDYNDEMIRLPGLQMTGDLMIGDQISIIKKKGYETCKAIYETIYPKKTVHSALQTSWVFISTPNNPVSKYHNHLIFSLKEKGILTHFTWIYYIQVPDNCTGHEGHIFFKKNHVRDDDENAFSFFPEEGCFYAWDSEIPHRPELSPNSTLDRVIIAGNVHFNTDIK